MGALDVAASRLLPSGVDPLSAGLVTLGFASLYLPTYWSLSHTIWASDEQGHGPIILAICLWLLWRKRVELVALSSAPAPIAGWGLLVLALAVYVLGRSQAILMFEVGSQLAMVAAVLLLFKGWPALRSCWFPLFFLIFMIPLPGPLVAAVTGPLKAAVSAVATMLLSKLGYPIGRSGVVLTVGQFQLLVADACAGLNSMFSLEALGLLYMNLMRHSSALRNMLLALLIVPISFCSNVVRVVILVLVTYHFGDAAGQGFVHGFAGMVLFLVALALILTVDRIFGWFIPDIAHHPMSPTGARP
jgi:exosortase B